MISSAAPPIAIKGIVALVQIVVSVLVSISNSTPVPADTSISHASSNAPSNIK